MLTMRRSPIHFSSHSTLDNLACDLEWRFCDTIDNESPLEDLVGPAPGDSFDRPDSNGTAPLSSWTGGRADQCKLLWKYTVILMPRNYIMRLMHTAVLQGHPITGSKSSYEDTATTHCAKWSYSGTNQSAAADPSRDFHDSPADTWVYVDPPLQGLERDEYEYERYIKPYETPISVPKDVLIIYYSVPSKLFDPTIQYRYLQHRELVNKLPSNVKYVVDLTLPIDGEGACLSIDYKSSVTKHI